MNCELVERQLSAYHDSALDADTTTQVKHHLASCAHCAAVLNDYTRFDTAIASLPHVAPRPELRDRLFASPEFQAIVHHAPAAHTTAAAPARPVGAPHPHLIRTIGQIAAILVFLVGAGVVITNITAHSRHGGLIFAVCPEIAAGPHLIYRAGGTLHSGDAKLVCDPQVQVGATWQVSPDGQWIAYVNTTTGALRVVRSDATGDHIVVTGGGTVVALAWAPDSAHLAIITHTADTEYHMALATPTSTSVASYRTFQATQTPQSLRWSPNSALLTWTFTDPTAVNQPQSPRIGTLLVQGMLLSSRAVDGVVATGVFVNAHPSPNYPDPQDIFLTFATGQNGIVTTLGSERFTTLGSGLAASGAGPSIPVNDAKAVAFSSATGTWAVAQSDGTVVAVDALTGKTTPLAHLSNVTQLSWSPSGTYLTATSGTTLWLIAPNGVKQLATNLNAVTPTWGQHDAQLGFAANGTVMTVDVTTGTTTALTALPAGAAAGLVWSTAGQLAVWNSQGFTIAGAATAIPLAEAPQWSVAG